MRHLRHFNLPETITNPSMLPVTLKRDDWFVASKGGTQEETDPMIEEMNHQRVKVKKVAKTILVVLGIVAFLALGYYSFRDFLAPNFYGYKIY